MRLRRLGPGIGRHLTRNIITSEARRDTAGIEYLVTPFKLSRIALGTWAIGGWMWGGTDETAAIGVIHEAVDRGVTLQPPRFSQYLRAVERLDRFAQENYGKRVIHLALRWVLDREDPTIALWGARSPDQPAPIATLSGWHIDASDMTEINRILSETVVDAVGPEFMAPPVKLAA